MIKGDDDSLCRVVSSSLFWVSKLGMMSMETYGDIGDMYAGPKSHLSVDKNR